MVENKVWQSCKLKVTHPPLDFSHQTLEQFLIEQSISGEMNWLLVFSMDGINWGLVQSKKILLSSQDHPECSPSLRLGTLQSLRLFGENGELLLWREGENFRTRLLLEGEGQETLYRDYPMLLWGSEMGAGDHNETFQILREGAQGFLHAPPLVSAGVHNLPAALTARDYLDTDKHNGQVYIRWNRLTGFTEGGE